MAVRTLDSVTWDEIDLSESYLVCGMFEEASNLASSILECLHDNKYNGIGDEIVICDMMTSAAMVLIQSWRELGRTSDVLNELKIYFGSAIAVPVEIILTSACVQLSGGHSSGVCSFLENFLAKWELDDGKYHAISHPDAMNSKVGTYDKHSLLEVDQYLEVVEFYAFTLLGGALNDVNRAISWVEKAQLPEEARQDMLRRLLSLSVPKTTTLPQASVSSSMVEESESDPLIAKEVKRPDKSVMVLESPCPDGGKNTNVSIWAYLRTIRKRCSDAVVSLDGKIVLGLIVFLICYYIRKKRDTVMRVLRRRVSSLKQALVDTWQLAFSYQVNPLAAVQSLPVSANRGG